MNRAARNARQSRRHRRFGSIGNVSPSLPTGRPLTLMFLGYQREGGGRTHVLYESGRWKKVNETFRTDEDITLHYKVLGDGVGFLMGSHTSSGVESLLFVRPVKQGEGSLTVRIPLPKLLAFRIALATSLPTDIDGSELTAQERAFYAANALSISPTRTPNTQISPSLGALGFIPKNTLDFKAKGKTTVGNREYWDGKLDKHSFERHGYTGTTDTFQSSGKAAKPIGPTWVSYPTALHAFRAAYYYADEGTADNFGWHAITKPNYRMGTAIPIAMVGQMVWHDDDSITGSVKFGDSKKENRVFDGIGNISDEQLLAYDQAVGDFSELGWSLKKAYKGAKKKVKKAAKKVKKVAKKVGKAVDNIIPEVNAPGNPEYHWSKGKVSREKIWFMDKSYGHQFPDQIKESNEKKRLNAKWPAGTVLEVAIEPSSQYRFKLPNPIPGIPKADPEAGKSMESNGNYSSKDVRRLAMKVEWYNPKDGKWTLGRHPPYDPEIKGKGKFVVYFRFPRQLASKDPDVKHWNGFDMNPNSKNGGTAFSYPKYSNGKLLYNIVGRPEIIQDGKKIAPTVKVGNTTLQGTPDYNNVVCCLARGKHNAIHVASTQIFAVTDVDKQAYLTQPNFSNIFWKEGEFAPGCKLIVVGQALTGFQRGAQIGMTTSRTKTAMGIYNENYNIKRTNNMGGTKDSDLMSIVDVITTADLEDDVDLVFNKRAVEANVKMAWKEVFGSDLSTQWFYDINAGLKDKEGNPIPGLLNADPDNPLNYNVSMQGQEFSFPYSIAIVEVPSNWCGPVLDFEEKAGDWTVTEKSIKEGANGEAIVYFVGTNSLRYDVKQKINMSGEIKEQLAALSGGMSPSESLLTAGQIPDAMVEVSHQAYHDRVQAPAEAEPIKQANWGIFDFLRPKPFQTDSKTRAKTLLPVGKKIPLGGLSGMNHEIEDVSNVYAADRVTALGSLGKPVTGPKTDIQEMFLINPSDPTSANLGWFTQSQPRPSTVRARPQIPQFGSAYARSNLAKKRGHIMSEQDFPEDK